MTILFVCTANVCRSPVAEGYLKSLVAAEGLDIRVESAGISALIGYHAFECSVEVARIHGFDITDHLARQLTPDMVQSADQILCMETWQASRVMDMDPTQPQKAALLGRFHPKGHPLFQIGDPLRFDVPEMLQTFQLIQASIDRLFQTLKS